MKEVVLITGASSILTKHLKVLFKKNRDVFFLSITKNDQNNNVYLKEKKLNKILLESLFSYEKIHIIHCAGKFEKKNLREIDENDWINFFDVHLFYLHNIIKELINEKEKIGNIVAISTSLTNFYNKNNYLYITSKSALKAYIKQLAYNEGILANVISPGYFRSNMNQYKVPTFNYKELPFKREISSKEISTYIYNFIISNKIIMGQDIYIDGGATLGY